MSQVFYRGVAHYSTLYAPWKFESSKDVVQTVNCKYNERDPFVLDVAQAASYRKYGRFVSLQVDIGRLIEIQGYK